MGMSGGLYLDWSLWRVLFGQGKVKGFTWMGEVKGVIRLMSGCFHYGGEGAGFHYGGEGAGWGRWSAWLGWRGWKVSLGWGGWKASLGWRWWSVSLG